MGKRTIYERFMWLDDQAKRGRYPNTSSLASKFEISTKTAQRDIEFMRDRLASPLIYNKSRKGYYYNDNTYTLPALYLSTEELSSLLIAKKILADIYSGVLGDEVSQVIAKLTSILNDSVSKPDQIDNIISFKLVEYIKAPDAELKLLLEGCLKKHSLLITYNSPQYDTRTERIIDPYHLINYMGTWHLIAYCHLRNDLRDFVVGRISSNKLLDDIFEIPKKFDIDKYLNSAFGIYKGKRKIEVTLRFTPNQSKWIEGQIWYKQQKIRLMADGSLELSFPVASFDEIIMEVLKHGAGVEVIKPDVLRKLVKEEVKKIINIYK